MQQQKKNKTGEREYDEENLFDDRPSGDSDHSSKVFHEEREAIRKQLRQAKEEGLTLFRTSSLVLTKDDGEQAEVRSRSFQDIERLSKELLFQFGTSRPVYIHSFHAGYAYEVPPNMDQSDLIAFNGDEDEFVKRCKKVRHYVVRYAS